MFKRSILILLLFNIITISHASEDFNFNVKEVYKETCEILHYTPINEKIIIQGIKIGQTRYEEATRTIYIRTDQVSEAVLAHEFCHVILANRFVAYPNEFISELLAKYCEFEMRRRKNESNVERENKKPDSMR